MKRWALLLSLCAASARAEPLVDALACGACHAGLGDARPVSPAPDLSAARYDGAWLFTYLRAPRPIRKLGRARMPDFGLSPYEALALTRYLRSLTQPGAPLYPRPTDDAALDAYRRAGEHSPDATAERGAHIFRNLRCGACHPMGDAARPPRDAPDLSFEGLRVTRAWLADYLRKPTRVRPAGTQPGRADRMPDFRLAEAEVRALTDDLMRRKRRPEGASARVAPIPRLTAFQTRKAERLVREKLACLGCHRLGAEGGDVGPELSSLAERLQPAYVRAMLEAPQSWIPDAVMPTTHWRPGQLDLVTAYLVGQQIPADEGPRPLVEGSTPLLASPAPTTDYGRYCAVCHGRDGKGRGFNAHTLTPAPTAHADPAAMSRRPDDTLYDGIFAGGAVLGKSHRMPAFGRTLSPAKIRALVKHIRALCACTGPAWTAPATR